MSKEFVSKISVSAAWDGCELDLAASPRGLFELVSALRTSAFGVYRLNVMPSVKESPVSFLEIRSGIGRLVLTIEENNAVFCGSSEALSLLAKNLENLRLLWVQGNMQHFHFDPSSDALLLSPESEAFIVGPP